MQRSSRARLIALLTLGCVLSLGVLAAWNARALVEWRLRALLGPSGDLRVAELGLHGITFREILAQDPELGLDSASVERLRIEWTLSGLLQGQLDRLEIRKAKLRLTDTPRPGATSGPPREAPPESTVGSGAAGALAVASRRLRSVSIDDVTVEFGAYGDPTQLAGRIEVSRSQQGALSGAASLTLSQADMHARLDASLSPVASTPVASGPVASGQVASGQASMSDRDFAHLVLDASAESTGERPYAAALRGELELHAIDDGFELRPSGCLELGVERARFASGWELLDPIRTCASQGPDPLVSLRSENASLESFELRFAAALDAFSVRIGSIAEGAFAAAPSGRPPPSERTNAKSMLQANVGGARVTLERTRAASPTWQVRASGNRLRLDPLEIDLADWSAVASGGSEVAWRAHVESEEARDRTSNVRFRPVALSIDLEASPGDTSLTVAARATPRDARSIELRMSGTVDPSAASSQLELIVSDSAKPELGAEASALLKALPPLSDSIQSARGRVRVESQLNWQAGRLSLDAKVAPRDLDLATPFGTFEGLRGRLHVLGPSPWRTAGAEELSAARITYGLRISDARLRFERAAKGQVAIRSFTAELGGGRVRVVGTYDASATSNEFELGVDGIDVAVLLERIDLPGLSATGKLEGTLPIVESGGSFAIRQGELRARDGVIRYQPAAPIEGPGSMRDLRFAFEVLRDFRYDLLRLQMDGDIRGTTNTKVYLDGRNPAVQAGREVQFTLNLEARLANLLQLPVLGIPAQIRSSPRP